jgi:hypothetical protein
MISQRDLLERPEEYEPLSSVKSIRNKETKMPKINMVNLFVSEENRNLLKRNLYRISQSNGSNNSKEYIIKLVESKIPAYLRSHDINKYRMAEYQALGFNDYAILLRHINIEFIKFCYSGLKWNQFNPFREYVEVGPTDDRRQVKFSDVMPQDIPTINVWAIQDVAVSSSKLRHGNNIPYFQAHMHQRHYDNANEGFKAQSANESSLEAPIYKYDMKPIHDTLGSWTKKGWFGL